MPFPPGALPGVIDMGGGDVTFVPPPGPGPGSGPPTPDPTTLLNMLYNLEFGVYGPGGSRGIIEYYTVASGGVSQLLFNAQKLVKKAIVINMSTDTEYLFSNGFEGGPIGVTLKGFPLAPATSTGLAGGSIPMGNVDLGTFSILGATTGDPYVIYYEI
jgi:hypothetical protein